MLCFRASAQFHHINQSGGLRWHRWCLRARSSPGTVGSVWGCLHTRKIQGFFPVILPVGESWRIQPLLCPLGSSKTQTTFNWWDSQERVLGLGAEVVPHSLNRDFWAATMGAENFHPLYVWQQLQFFSRLEFFGGFGCEFVTDVGAESLCRISGRVWISDRADAALGPNLPEAPTSLGVPEGNQTCPGQAFGEPKSREKHINVTIKVRTLRNWLDAGVISKGAWSFLGSLKMSLHS